MSSFSQTALFAAVRRLAPTSAATALGLSLVIASLIGDCVISGCFRPAQAAVLTVGLAGSYATIAAALADARDMPGDDEVRVQSGVYSENLVINFGGSGDRVDLTGSWDAAFAVQNSVANSIIDGMAAGRVIDFSLSAGDHLRMDRFVIQNGLADLRAGVFLDMRGVSRVEMTANIIRNNRAEADRASAAGLFAWVLENSQLDFIGNEIRDNVVNSTGTVDARGGGGSIQVENSGFLNFFDNQVVDNQVIVAGAGSALGGGLDISGFEATTEIEISDNLISGNQLSGGSTTGTGVLLSGSNWRFRRNTITSNLDNSANGFAAQLALGVFGGPGLLSDTLVAMGNSRGVQLNANTNGVLHVTNLTVVDHPERGILGNRNDASSVLNVYNSIAVNNGTNIQLNAGSGSGSNITLNNPALFVNAAAGDYQLAELSPAIDIGDATPPGGLGSTDLAGGPRVQGAGVDIGAFEFTDVLFADGFE
ncbi:MAG: hypothetical protein Tsb002_37240 [Wenzhouxiangellaceae bacterium]